MRSLCMSSRNIRTTKNYTRRTWALLLTELISHGPCRVSGPLTCFIGYSLMLHCYAHSLWSLLFSFSYRYYVLCYLHPRKCIIKAIIVVIYIPSFIQFVSFCFASDNESKVRAVIVRNFGYDVTSECVSGHLNILHAETLYTILHMTIPIVPIYTAILILRKLTMLKLHCQGNMSEKTRHLHSQLLKALTVQACLPILFLFAVTTYGIGQLKIYNHPLLEYSTFILIGLIPMLSPLTSIYFVSPYRVWIFNKLREPWTRCRMWKAQSHPHMEQLLQEGGIDANNNIINA
ncbi:Serpentine receptor class delta-18 [Trichostrongylus colubriformis]|uniref:Serpentine receptor class delta-18 n=1 Tax=Trichostrongylus colubriformis TaxID=6319 RepID=A0AAN8J3H5_TRICO